jgi:hypothetical protein
MVESEKKKERKSEMRLINERVGFGIAIAMVVVMVVMW